MHELPAYRVTTRQRPTWFTQETLIGFLLPLAAPPLALALAPIGALIGGLYGRARIERENREGKIVPPPTYFNKTMLLGLAMGVAAMTGVGALAGVTGFYFAALVTGTEAASLIGAAAYAAAGLAAVVSAGYMGAVQGRHRMDAEYHYARIGGTPMDGPMHEAKPTPQKMLDQYTGLEPAQKTFVANEIARRQQNETNNERSL